MSVRRAREGDEGTLRSLRLQAMEDSPSAFGSTYEREAARTVADWQRWLSPGATFLFEPPHGEPAGLVASVLDDADPSVAHLMAMWVHPASRGTGGGDALVGEVLAWAAEAGATAVRLYVRSANLPAVRLYERHGFARTGRERIRPPNGFVDLEMMALPLRRRRRGGRGGGR